MNDRITLLVDLRSAPVQLRKDFATMKQNGLPDLLLKLREGWGLGSKTAKAMLIAQNFLDVI